MIGNRWTIGPQDVLGGDSPHVPPNWSYLLGQSDAERWRELCRQRDEAYVQEIIQRANAERDALYVDPYREMIGLFLEYECGIPHA